MSFNRNTGRIIGVLLLSTYILGIVIFQFLQAPFLFADEFLTITSPNANSIISSTLLGILSGIISIIIATILLPLFKKYSTRLALLYFAFCIINFVSIAIDNISVLSILELSSQYVKAGTNNIEFIETLGAVFYKNHWWTHYTTILVSSFSTFILYITMYYSKLIPRIISVIGIGASFLMFTEMIFRFYELNFGLVLLLPIALIQLITPIWLMSKGFELSKNKD